MADLQTTARELRLMASLRAKVKLENNEFTEEFKRIESIKLVKAGTAIDCRMANSATTTIISTSVKPKHP